MNHEDDQYNESEAHRVQASQSSTTATPHTQDDSTQNSTQNNNTPDGTEGVSMENTEDLDENGWDQATEDLFPNPDAPSPSDCFLQQFKEILDNFDNDKWE